MLKERGVAVIEDVRAVKRDNYAPTQITTVYADGDVADLIDSGVDASPCPVALVTDTGRVFVLSAGGSGQIVVVGGPTAEQDEAVVKVMDVLHDLWGVKQSAPKKGRKIDPVKEPVIEAEDVPSFLQVLDAIANFEENHESV
jgi:hypothetical protein